MLALSLVSKYLIVICLLLEIYGCKGKGGYSDLTTKNSLLIKEISKDSIIDLQIDSLSLGIHRFSGFYEVNKHTYFSFYNELNGNIYAYSLKDSCLKWKLPISDFKISKSRFGGYSLTEEGDIVIGDAFLRSILVFDTERRLKKVIDFNLDTSYILPVLRINSNTPIKIVDDLAIFGGYNYGEFTPEIEKRRRHIFCVFNKNTSYFGSNPPCYNTENWAGSNFRISSHLITKEFVYLGFPGSPIVQKYTLFGEFIEQKSIVSKNIKKIDPLNFDKSKTPSSNIRNEFFDKSSMYGQFAYNFRNGNIFRIVVAKSKRNSTYKFSILEFTPNLELVNEFMLAETNILPNCFYYNQSLGLLLGGYNFLYNKIDIYAYKKCFNISNN